MSMDQEPLMGMGGRDGGKDGTRRKSILAMIAFASILALLAMLAIKSGMDGNSHRVALLEENLDLDSFEPSKIYKTADPNIDFDHPNRVDNYGCLFSNCADSASGGSVLNKGEKQTPPSPPLPLNLYWPHAAFCCYSLPSSLPFSYAE